MPATVGPHAVDPAADPATDPGEGTGLVGNRRSDGNPATRTRAGAAVRTSTGATVRRMTFRGWPADAFDFYQGLEADNSKTYWQANKARYEESVKAPFEALLAELDEEFGPFRLFRPYRDVRFSKDKSPYKTAAAASSEGERGTGLYVQLSAAGLMVGSGYYHMASDQLGRFRDAVDDEADGEAIVAICAALEKAGPRDRRVRGAQDRAARLPEGPSPHRLPAPQGSGGHAVLPRGGLAAHGEGGGPGGRGLAPGAADERLAGRPRRPERAAARRRRVVITQGAA